eukprot:1141755-Pelagomonas_calceolata.AAC.1
MPLTRTVRWDAGSGGVLKHCFSGHSSSMRSSVQCLAVMFCKGYDSVISDSQPDFDAMAVDRSKSLQSWNMLGYWASYQHELLLSISPFSSKIVQPA